MKIPKQYVNKLDNWIYTNIDLLISTISDSIQDDIIQQ